MKFTPAEPQPPASCRPDARQPLRFILRMAILAAALCACAPEPATTETEDGPAPDNRLIVEGVSVLITSGTTTLRNVQAERAAYNEDTQYLEAINVTLSLNLVEQDLTITAQAAEGEVFLAGQPGEAERFRTTHVRPTPPLYPAGAPQPTKTPPPPAGSGIDGFLASLDEQQRSEPVGLEKLREVAALPRDKRHFGDILLHGPVVGRSTNGGIFYTDQVLWSDHLKRLLVPTSFRQEFLSPDGIPFVMTGSAFEVDSTLRDWVCYVDDQPGYLVWGNVPDHLNPLGATHAPPRPQ